ncbi:anti-sigma factor family protein [Hydrocarboniphaga sp.]|uniref:anti-sigma factor family protein n=1 Tax=Hydrocarboniphaga sp. TaxID=2033016 RepID=UPI003D0DF502
MHLSDDLLSAYLDGELDAEAAARVESALAGDLLAQQRLQQMRANDSALKAAMRLPDIAPRDPLAARILGSSAPPAVTRIAPRRASRAASYRAMAAGVGGLALGYLLSQALTPGATAVAVIDASLSGVLDSVASGQASADRATRISLSFKAADGRYCRVFSRSGADYGEGLACRDASGWQLVAWDASQGEAAGGYQPAGGNDMLDAVMDRLGGGAALDVQQERALIDAHWSP